MQRRAISKVQLELKLKGFQDVRMRYLEILIYIERILSSCKSDDFERYVKMGLRIEPQNSGFLDKRGHGLEKRQENIPWDEKDYSYIEYYQKAYELERNPTEKRLYFHFFRGAVVQQYYFTGSLWQINHLIQFDSKPNLELKEPRLEIYKISLSFINIGIISRNWIFKSLYFRLVLPAIERH